MNCPATAYRPELSPLTFRCGLPLNHDGDHESHPDSETTVTWPSHIEFIIAPLRPPVPAEVPFDRRREQWFTGICANEQCSGIIRGRSLDGAPAYWWHDLGVLDYDHDADPGDRKEP